MALHASIYYSDGSMYRALFTYILLGLSVACGPADSGGANESGNDINANADGDCMTDVEEAALGTDPNEKDSDGDGVSDCDEIDAVSDPLDGEEVPYACGWAHNDPGTIQPTGAAIGDTLYDAELPDQCGENVSIWDFYGKYHVLYMTAAW